MIDNNTTASNNLSDNKIASDNKLSLCGDVKVDVHFEELAMLFFKPTRSAMLQTRLLEFYRVQVETVSRILDTAKNIADKHGLHINPIPSKLSIPLLEKMSAEHEEDMYELWAKLLVGVAANCNPIHVQYAEILSKLDTKNAKELLNIYNEITKNIKGKFNYQILDDTLAFEIYYDNIEADCYTKMYEHTKLLENLNLIKVVTKKHDKDNQLLNYSTGCTLTPLGYDFITELERYNIEDK